MFEHMDVLCAICGNPADPDKVVVLEAIEDEFWCVAAVGLQPGAVITGTFVFVDAACLRKYGTRLSSMILE